MGRFRRHPDILFTMTESEPRKEAVPTLEYKQATPADAAAFVELERAVATSKTYSGVLSVEEALQEFTENETYLIYQNGKLVGSTQFEMKGPDHAYLSGLVIHPDFQGRGIAREAALFRLNKLRDVKRIDVVTHPENAKILHLYKSLGFTVEKRIENYYGDGEPRLLLVKQQ